jgi:aminomethyltransferase
MRAHAPFTFPLRSSCGYTGEDGFELSVPHTAAQDIAVRLLEQKFVNVAGLGARNTLRLEAGLPLFGTDITMQTSPGEAGLDWTIAPRRRRDGGFFGAQHIQGAAVCRRRVGLIGMPRPIHDAALIFDHSGQQEIGHITSSAYAPSLRKPIAMGYVAVEHGAVGTPVLLQVRGQMVRAQISAMPFVKTQYYRYVPDPQGDNTVVAPAAEPQYNTEAHIRRDEVSKSKDFHDPFAMFEPYEYD